MIRFLLIAGGGATGSLLRYLMSISIYSLLGRNFPYGTLTVNVIGAFLMGFFSMFFFARYPALAEKLGDLVLIGFLGGFTTFSTFSLETLALLENGETLRAALNVGLSVGLCLIAVGIGANLGRVSA